MNAAISNLIREGKTSQMTTIMQTGSKQGNRLLNDSLTKLIKDNIITFEEANSKALDKEGLAQKEWNETGISCIIENIAVAKKDCQVFQF